MNQGGTTPSGLVIKSDGTTDYAASLEAIKAKALELQKKAQSLASQNDTTTVPTPTKSSVVSSSAPVVAGENKTIADLQSLTTDDAAITQAHNDYLAQLKAEQEALEARRIQEEAQINAAFDTKKTQTESAQKGEKGTFTTTLARIGGYLGDSASAAGAMVNLNQTHQFQLNDLEAKRQGALQEARNAITDKQFAIARLKTEEAKDYASEISKSKQQFFENNLKILQEQRQQDETNRTVIKDKLSNMALLDPAQIPDGAKKEIDDFYGIPGFTDKYINVTAASAKAKTQKEVLAVQKDLLGLLQDIPAGQKVKFPDGTEYTGMGKTSDITTFTETDSNGYVRMFTYNKGSREVTVQNIGAVGKPSADGIDKSNPKIVNASNAMEQLVDPKSGYIPVDAYIAMYRAYVKENNGKGQEFIQNFDPLIWTGLAKDFLVQGASTDTTEEE